MLGVLGGWGDRWVFGNGRQACRLSCLPFHSTCYSYGLESVCMLVLALRIGWVVDLAGAGACYPTSSLASLSDGA
jgi:hypothetical protein